MARPLRAGRKRRAAIAPETTASETTVPEITAPDRGGEGRRRAGLQAAWPRPAAMWAPASRGRRAKMNGAISAEAPTTMKPTKKSCG